MDLNGAVMIGRDYRDEMGLGASSVGKAATEATKPITRLTRIGFKLAVLGMEDKQYRTAYDARWHYVRPGSYSMPILGDRLTYGTSLCGRMVVTNGYASDFNPTDGALCLACKEQV